VVLPAPRVAHDLDHVAHDQGGTRTKSGELDRNHPSHAAGGEVRGAELSGVGVSWMLSEKQPTQEKSRSNPNGTVLGKRATEMPTSCGPPSKVSSYVPAFAPHHIEASYQTCVPLATHPVPPCLLTGFHAE
jgi:hypothetical protein